MLISSICALYIMLKLSVTRKGKIKKKNVKKKKKKKKLCLLFYILLVKETSLIIFRF